MYSLTLKLAGFSRNSIYQGGNLVQGPGPGDKGGRGVHYVDPSWDTAGYDIAINFFDRGWSMIGVGMGSEAVFCNELKRDENLWKQANESMTFSIYRVLLRFHKPEVDVYPSPHAIGYLGVCKPCKVKVFRIDCMIFPKLILYQNND